MKKIVVNNRTFHYKVVGSECDYETVFYEGEETYTRRKYFLFGEKITKVRPKEVFTIYQNANDPNIDKKWWLKAIEEKIKYLNRKKEIEEGILI
jgi:hypothetical protein